MKLFRFFMTPFRWLGRKFIDLLAWLGDVLVNALAWLAKAIFKCVVLALRFLAFFALLLVDVLLFLLKLLFYATIGKLFSRFRHGFKRDHGLSRHKDALWEAAEPIPGKNPKLYKQDSYGNPMFWRSYGKYSPMGWMLDHTWPLRKGGSNKLKNLQALQTAENSKKTDKLVHRPFKKLVARLRTTVRY